MLKQQHEGEEDDGFGDFLSEDEEECALQTQEMASLARKMKTVGVRDAIDWGKESSLQEGFDAGFSMAARDGFRFSALRGLLLVAQVSGLAGSLSEEETAELSACMEALRLRSQRVPTVAVTKPETIVDGAADAPAEIKVIGEENSRRDDEDDALVARATEWAIRLQLPVERLREHQ